jgi:hypothetical protein
VQARRLLEGYFETRNVFLNPSRCLRKKRPSCVQQRTPLGAALAPKFNVGRRLVVTCARNVGVFFAAANHPTPDDHNIELRGRGFQTAVFLIFSMGVFFRRHRNRNSLLGKCLVIIF